MSSRCSPHASAEAVGDLPDGGVGRDRLDERREEVVGAPRGLLDPPERRLPGGRVALRPDAPDGLDLAPFPLRVDRLEGRRRGRLVAEAVHADDDPLAGLDLALGAVRGLLDLALLEAGLDRREGSSEPVDLGEKIAGRRLELVRERLHEVASRPAGSGVSVTPAS